MRLTGATVAPTCAALYATLTSHQPTMAADFTEMVLDSVIAALEPYETLAYPELLTAFAQAEHDHLAHMVATYGPASDFRNLGVWGSHPFEIVHSPAVIAVCERLSVAPMRLRAEWEDRWESDTMLEDVRGAWG